MPWDISQSKLRQRPTAEILAWLGEQGITWDGVLLCTSTDLSTAGQSQACWIVVSKDRLICLPEVSAPDEKPFILPIGEISKVRLRTTVGSVILQCQSKGLWIDVARFTNEHRERFERLVLRLKQWLQGEEIRLEPADDRDERRCEKCGFPLAQHKDICPRCIKRGAVMGRTLKLMLPYWKSACVLFLLVLGGICLDLLPPTLTGILVDRVLAKTADQFVKLRNLELLGWLVAALIGAQLIRMGITIAINRLSAVVGTRVTFDMRRRLFERLQQMSVDYYDRNQVGVLMSRITADTEAMHHLINQATQGFLVNILLVIGVGIRLFQLNPRLAWFVLIPTPFVMLGTYFFWTSIYPKYNKAWDSGSKLAAMLNTVLSGIRLVKAFAQERREADRFITYSTYQRQSRLSVDQQAGSFFPFLSFIFSLGGMMVWYLGGKDVIGEKISLGTLMAFFGYLGMFYSPLSNLTMLSNWFSSFMTSAQRVFEILDSRPQIVDVKQPRVVERLRGEIVFENVIFGYDPYNPVLKGISFKIAAGEKIGIVGKSGSGKTTIVNLACRFYDPNRGVIRLDGIDIRELRKEDIHRSVALVLQDSFLFRGSIASNISYGRPKASLEEIMAAAKAAYAHEFIIKLPQGYDMRLGENGAGLSGGEKQRISIARALLCDPRILILDEATSSVDTESEKHIQDALKALTRGRTTIAVAHRLSTLRDADRIFVVDAGRIIEQGHHRELMALGGLYHRLVKIQTQLTSEPSVSRLVVEMKT